jgi:large subunit ribosomal protein L10
MKRAEKQALIESMHQEFEGSPHAVLLDFRGLSVPAVTEFRRRVRRSGSRYRVVKNTLARRAAVGTPLEAVADAFSDTTGVAYTSSDPIELAKALVDFMRENPNLKVKAGIVSGTDRLDAEGVKALSAMPGMRELRARLLAVLLGPATQLARLLGTPAQQMARVLKAHEEKLEG